MDVKIEQSWLKVLSDEFEKPYFQQLVGFVREEYRTKQIFPPAKSIFNAFDTCAFDNVKVVIIGQDPYHGIGQAHGLSFSVRDGIELPPSLKNIYKEISDDLQITPSTSGNLTRWAEQGVFLLNASLTVRANLANSHSNCGWEQFTDEVIRKISAQKNNVVFLLWGNYAIQKSAFIDQSKHLILTAPHPSPLAAHRGFFGCRHFSKTNDYLLKNGLEAIDWI
ncbi:MAG: uracil-DNA glycosylase [Prevotellaceae bacterium]|jgi:uracil-DNA glycosylase|nr:uracil-DNA glycosylase [Prevotellaceae bacterium]